MRYRSLFCKLLLRKQKFCDGYIRRNARNIKGITLVANYSDIKKRFEEFVKNETNALNTTGI